MDKWLNKIMSFTLPLYVIMVTFLITYYCNSLVIGIFLSMILTVIPTACAFILGVDIGKEQKIKKEEK